MKLDHVSEAVDVEATAEVVMEMVTQAVVHTEVRILFNIRSGFADLLYFSICVDRS